MRAGAKVSAGVTAFAFLLLYLPLVVMVTLSFRKIGLEEGWTFEWYSKALQNQAVLDALGVSLWVGLWTTLVSCTLGTAAAFALERGSFPGKKALDAMIHVPLILPEIVMGLSLLIWFVALKITLGSFSIILAHITFSLSYVVLTIRARLEGFDRTLEEAARDLGATRFKTFTHVTFPLIFPGVLSGALLAFTLSFDDFLVAFFTAGAGSDTLPLKIYGMIKYGMTPEINALSTVMLGLTLLLVLAFFRPFK